MIKNILAFFFGDVLLLLFPVLPNVNWLFVLVPISGIVLYYAKRTILYLLSGLLLGFCWNLYYCHQLIASPLPTNWHHKDLILTGTIDSVPLDKINTQQFTFQAQQVCLQQQCLEMKMRLSLSWYHSNRGLVPGDKWQLMVRLKHPHSYRNPGSFDYEAYLFRQGITAVGYVKKSHINQLVQQHAEKAVVNRLRQYLHGQILHPLFYHQWSGLLSGLVVGIKANISTKQRQILQNTGTSHLLAISGLHIGLLATICFYVINWLWTRWRIFVLYVPAKSMAAIVTILISWCYGILAGLSIATLRACLMISFVMLCLLAQKNILRFRILIASLLLVLILDPLSPLTSGFFLSFTAVGLILYLSAHQSPHQLKIYSVLKMQWILLIGLMPLTIFYYQQVSWIAFIANLIAIPWVSFVIVPCGLVGAVLLLMKVGVYQYLFAFAKINLAALLTVLAKLSQLPLNAMAIGMANWTVLLTTIVAIVVCLAPRGFKYKWIAIIWLLPLWCPTDKWYPGAMTLTVLDVGQGLASIVRTQHHILVFDTGAKFINGNDMANMVIIPYFKSQGIDHIDRLVVSHGDNDHIGGAATLLAQYPAKHILTSAIDKFPQQQPILCQRGQSWDWDGVHFAVLYPDSVRSRRRNEQSCVIRVSNHKFSILLTGDIESRSEQYLVKNGPDQLSADVLIVPHHGSKSSSSVNFVEAVSPKIAIISAGYANRYHLPDQQVLKRYQDIGSTIMRTDRDGAIKVSVLSTNNVFKCEAYRVKYQRFWHFR